MRADGYTPQEDAAILAAVAAGTPYRRIAAELGRSRSGVMARAARLDRPPAEPKRRLPPRGAIRHKRHWTAAEQDYLRTWWGLRPNRAVARRLGRTVRACEGMLWLLRTPWRANVRPLAAVARLFGVADMVVRRWVRTGALTGRRLRRQGPGRLWHFPDEALRCLVREHPERYDVARMAPGHWLTALAREVNGPEPWVTTAAAGAAVHYERSLIRRLAADGIVPARRRPYAGQGGSLLVRVSDVAAALRQRGGRQGAPGLMA